MSDRVRVFLSHSHADDAFARKLADDLTHAGADVWVDFADITFDNFLKKIDEGLKDRQWLVLVMTPPALRSEFVQMEVTAALLQVAKHSMRGVIPVLAAPCSDKEIPATWAPLHRYDATRDYQSALAGLINALGLNVQPDGLPKSPIPPLPRSAPSSRTIVVDSQGGGDYPTVSKAIEAAQPGDRIEIRAGLYRESGLTISKPLDLVGTGADPEDVVLAFSYAIRMTSPRGRIQNLMLDGGELRSTEPLLEIEFGRPEVEHCVFANGRFCAMVVKGLASPFVARCTIRNCSHGVFISGKAHFEENDIFDCSSEGINVSVVRDVTLRNNRVHSSGIGIEIGRGSAVLERNSIYTNQVGILMNDGGSALARANLISGNQSGVQLVGDGGGVFEDNDMRGNRDGAWNLGNNPYEAGGRLDNVRQARNIFDTPQGQQ